jgi:ATP-dependent DNA ligase
MPAKSVEGGLAALAVSPDTPPMEASLVDHLPTEPGWQFEPKWDGFRCLAFRAGPEIALKAKSGKPLGRYFPEVEDFLLKLETRQFVIDGELVIPRGDSLSFDDLQLRLHPAESRIRKLARETPARFILFDCLLDPRGRSLLQSSLAHRRQALEDMVSHNGGSEDLPLSPYTLSRSEAEEWLARAGGDLDGVMAKRRDGPYEPGERSMLKVKRLRTADCVVGGFRYGQNSHEVGSLLLGLYNAEGKLDHIGFTSSFAAADKAQLTRKLEMLRGGVGFDGNAPGGPSRWSTERSAEWVPVKPNLVVEVRYDHVTGKRFRHGTKLLRFRPDKAPRQCTFDQLGRDTGAAKVNRLLFGDR